MVSRGLIGCVATTLALAMAPQATAATPAASAPATAEKPVPLDAYGDLPGVEQMALSPDGRLLAILSRIKGTRRVLVIDPASGTVRTNADVGEAKLRGLDWAGNDIVLIDTSNTINLVGFTADKTEASNTLIVPIDAGAPRMIFSKSNAVAPMTQGHYGTRQIAGKSIGFYGGIPLVKTFDGPIVESGKPGLFKVDLRNGALRMVARPTSEDHFRDWLVDGDGNVAATFDLASASGRWTIANAGGKTIASGIDPKGKISLMFFGKDGSTAIYSVEDSTAEAMRWFEVPLAGGATAKEILEDVAIERVFVDPANGRLLGYLERGTPPVPHFFDPAHQQAVAKVLKAFPKLDVDIGDITPDFSRLVVRTSGTEDSGTWYLVDVSGRQAKAVGFDRPAIAAEMVGAVSTITYKAADGLEMDGILTLPPTTVLKGREAKKLPVVMLPHGGPHAADTASFDWWAQAFASRGYAVFQPNFRGSTNRTTAFRRAANGQWGRKMQTDISDGLAELARRGIVDPKRACIVGASYGGYAALAGVTLQHGLYRCAVAVAPIADLTMMYNADVRESGDNPMTSRNLRETLGSPATFAAVSPRRHAAEADAPVLLMHGKDDTVVPFRQSTAMADALRDAGKPVEMVVLRQEDHWLSRAATRKQMLEAAVAFVEKHDPAG